YSGLEPRAGPAPEINGVRVVRENPVGGEQEPAAGTQNPEAFGEVKLRIPDVLEDLGRKNGVVAPVLDRDPSLSGQDHVGLGVTLEVGSDIAHSSRQKPAVRAI